MKDDDAATNTELRPAALHRALEWFTPKASSTVGDRRASEKLADRAENKLFKRVQKAASEQAHIDGPPPPDLGEDPAEPNGARETQQGLERVWFYVMVFVRLVRAFARGDYRDVNKETIIVVTAALLYFVSPVDLIPDILPMGLIDDAAVLAFAARRVESELNKFVRWTNQQP